MAGFIFIKLDFRRKIFAKRITLGPVVVVVIGGGGGCGCGGRGSGGGGSVIFIVFHWLRSYS